MKKWVKQGLIWGLLMFVFMAFVLPLIKGSEIILSKVLISFVIWTIAGIAYGYLMRSKIKEES